MMIRELAADCTRALTVTCESTVPMESTGADDGRVESLRSDELNALSIRLLQRDVLAMKDLGILLSEPGRVTIHEFLSVILPALHAALIGQATGDRFSIGGPIHRNKKARASLISVLDSPDARIEYCREALRSMTSEYSQGAVGLGATTASRAHSPEMHVDPSHDSDVDDGSKVNIRYSPNVSEILRRLHQILSFYESVQVLSTSTEKATGLNTPSGGDLQSLTKPIELHLTPSDCHIDAKDSPSTKAVVYAEPLIQFSDLQLHVLRTYRILDIAYTVFCSR
jgi:hypothetical protein